MYIGNGNYQAFHETQRQHFYAFQNRLLEKGVRKEQKIEEYKWRGNWMRIVAQFLEMFPPDGLQQPIQVAAMQ